MERIVRGRSATLTKTFTFTPTGTPTVALTRVSDGTVVTTGTVSGAGAVWSYTIPASSNTLLDTYTETWTATTGGQPQPFTDYIEVAGDVLFTIDQARALSPLSNTSTYTDAKIADARTLAEQTIEDACCRAFVPRYRRETLSGTGTASLLLSRPDVRSIRSVTVTTSGVGTAYTAGELALLAVNPSGLVYSSGSYWAAGQGNITVGYEHGADYPPARVSQAALILARSLLVKGPVDDRALGQASAGGDFSFGLATPGRGGSYVGIPEVDAVIDQYNLRVGVA